MRERWERGAEEGREGKRETEGKRGIRMCVCICVCMYVYVCLYREKIWIGPGIYIDTYVCVRVVLCCVYCVCCARFSVSCCQLKCR